MKLGIKVGPRQQSISDLDATQAPACEVWFNISKFPDYEELFTDLRKRKIDVGLHFWGALPDGTWANIAYPDQTLIDESLKLMRQTIDIAAQNNFQYVNIHPGSSAKIKIDLVGQNFDLLAEPINFDLAKQLFIENVKNLNDYALNRNIVFTVETVPQKAAKTNWYDVNSRLNPISLYELSSPAIIAAANHGIFVANDFGHSAANLITDDAKAIWHFLKNLTEMLAPATRLIHLGFLQPPYNGTDIHDMLDNPLLETDKIIPNKNQMIELLKLFKNRDDVWIITEPREDHAKNFFLAQKILEQAQS